MMESTQDVPELSGGQQVAAAATAGDGKPVRGLRVCLISLHGLIRAREPELGHDADTGGQVRYVLELARELSSRDEIQSVELLTRQIIDPRVDEIYARVEEQISPRAKIVRIPCGPRRYLRKEALWPYVDDFVDQTLNHFRRAGLPDLIHGHYADAGLAGAQLSRLLGIPYIFTGHSLGRVKQQRLQQQVPHDKLDAKRLERRYRFTQRLEAEETALETASLVVTSTSQEVEQQYKVYDHYAPQRMEVIPPGVDLSAFHPPRDGEDADAAPIVPHIDRFLEDPAKSMILTMARPDERKNLEMLVRVFGESEELREQANLVIVMGTRDDLRDLPGGQRRVLKNILTLIDVYDLYGSVAYPKSHAPSDVPDLYRLAASRKGVFINPALTEPFGLTLLEAAASGLPVIATNDGGPRDILANCRNGLLIDPLDPEAIQRALLRALNDPESWIEWANNGLAGAEKHYSWSRHADRYLRDVQDLLQRSEAPVLTRRTGRRRLPEFDRMLITDLDDTLTGDDAGLAELADVLHAHRDHIGFGVATGRRLDSALALLDEIGLPVPHFLSTSAGTELHYGDHLTPDRTWQRQIGFQWKPAEVRAVLDGMKGLYRQDRDRQSDFKVSYEIDSETAPTLSDIRKTLREAGLRVKVVLSRGVFLDVLPVRGGSDLSVRHLAYKWGFSHDAMLVAGDSGNDEGMLKGRTLGVVVGNHGPELQRLRKLPRIYFAKACHARGVLEGIEYYNFLGHITIPNDRLD